MGLNVLDRMFGNMKTTIGGSAIGAAMMAAGAMVLSQAGCNFDDVQWWGILTAMFAGPAAVGAMATDNGKGV